VSSPAVVNASPLIFLSHAGRIDLLQIEGPDVCVPGAVAKEIHHRGAHDPTVRILKSTSWLHEVELVQPASKVLAWKLGLGETAVLSWALNNPGSVAIVDDLAARRCAEVLEIPFIGTLGLVLRAKRQGVLPAARPVVEELLAVGMYLSEKIIDQALALIGE
jgi:predicted nucleic acid-binding protein